jgi:hypothetical protein
MNKGVALLLERRETNPEEFKEGGGLRWADLLAKHDVLLDAPERKVLRPRTFNKEVFKRVLTGSDLERKSSILTVDRIRDEALRILTEQLTLSHKANIADEFK